MPKCTCGRELAEQDRMGKTSWVCPACGAAVKESSSPSSDAGGLDAATAALVARAAGVAESTDAPGRFTLGAMLAAGIGVGLAGTCFLVMRFGDAMSPWRPFCVIGIGVGGIVGLAGLLKLAGEALAPSPRDRGTPEKAIRAYLSAIGVARWDAALSCLSWVARDGSPVVRPAIEPVELPADRVPVSDAASLGRYWAPIRGGLATLRSFSWKLRDVRESGETAVARIDFRVDVDFRGLSVSNALKARFTLQSTVSTSFCAAFAMYRRDGRWYLLSAGLPPDTRFTVGA